eukprot:scaffold43996_cov24-Tisochrysis_lutea.AAC.5
MSEPRKLERIAHGLEHTRSHRSPSVIAPHPRGWGASGVAAGAAALSLGGQGALRRSPSRRRLGPIP